MHALVHTETAISEDDIIDVNAQQQKAIILTERRDITGARLVMQLFDELGNES